MPAPRLQLKHRCRSTRRCRRHVSQRLALRNRLWRVAYVPRALVGVTSEAHRQSVRLRLRAGVLVSVRLEPPASESESERLPPLPPPPAASSSGTQPDSQATLNSVVPAVSRDPIELTHWRGGGNSMRPGRSVRRPPVGAPMHAGPIRELIAGSDSSSGSSNLSGTTASEEVAAQSHGSTRRPPYGRPLPPRPPPTSSY